ncbi:MAG: hypothetical protein M3361_08065, partial [Candidatus Tectomicrobia bacterium]|nr:hypothetical protein [Candidatus Tectomicrobia bacterium]
MAKLEKSALSQYLRTRCDRFLYLSLFQTRGFEHTPFPLPGRPGIAAYRARGLEFERQKMAELHSLFGGRCRHIAEAAKRNRKHAPEDLFALQLRAAPSPPQYWLEPELKAGSFTDTLLQRVGITSQPYPDVSNLRPDVVELLDAETLGPQGVIHILDASGTIGEWDPTDGRQLLRVMDMKVSEHINT